MNNVADLLHEIACSGVELKDPRMGYVVVQMDADVWEAVQSFKRKETMGRSMDHPPLCPKTKIVFDEDPPRWGLFAYVDTSILFADIPGCREMLACYQACAWRDRADRWQSIGRRHLDWGMAGIHECMQNAYAWREWEKLP